MDGHTFEHYELIETLWNVNIHTATTKIFKTSRINRNIVECKFPSTSAVFGSPLELIETLWNVNLSLVGANRVGTCGINRNIVECK